MLIHVSAQTYVQNNSDTSYSFASSKGLCDSGFSNVTRASVEDDASHYCSTNGLGLTFVRGQTELSRIDSVSIASREVRRYDSYAVAAISLDASRAIETD